MLTYQEFIEYQQDNDQILQESYRDSINQNFVYYDENLGDNQKWVTISQIIVPTEYDKEQLLLAIKYFHDNPLINTDILAVNTLVHLYQNPELIKVSYSFNDFNEK